MQWCLETGILPDTSLKYMWRKQGVNMKSTHDVLGVDSDIIARALWIILKIGLGVSIIVFVFEKIFQYKRRVKVIKRMMWRKKQNSLI